MNNQHVANAVKAAETAVEENSLDTLWVAICFAYKAAGELERKSGRVIT